jgi:hypothetical protein
LGPLEVKKIVHECFLGITESIQVDVEKMLADYRQKMLTSTAKLAKDL